MDEEYESGDIVAVKVKIDAKSKEPSGEIYYFGIVNGYQQGDHIVLFPEDIIGRVEDGD